MKLQLVFLTLLLLLAPVFATVYTDLTNVTFAKAGDYADTAGVQILMKDTINLTNVTFTAGANASTCYIYNVGATVQYANASIVGNQAHFNILLNKTSYWILADNQGGLYAEYDGVGNFNISGVMVNYTCGVYAGSSYCAPTSHLYGGIASLTFDNTSAPAGNATLNLSVSLSSANETESRIMAINLTGSGSTFTAYNVTVVYNNTLILNESIIGAARSEYIINQTLVAPLVNANTTMAYQVNATVLLDNSSTIYCYQETATTATGCGGLNTGSYAWTNSALWSNLTGIPGPTNVKDGDWATYANAESATNYFFVNYTKPTGYNGAVWQMAEFNDGTLSINTINITVPSGCFNQSSLQFRISATSLSFSEGNNEWCYDGSGWQLLHSSGFPWQYFAEEAVWWSNTTASGTPSSKNVSSTQTVSTWYTLDRYNITKQYNYPVEIANNLTITLQTAPLNASGSVTNNASYALSHCMKYYNNGTNTSYACLSNLTWNDPKTGGYHYLTITPSHLLENGVIFSDNSLNRTYNLSYNATPESESRKQLSQVYNASREYFAWIVNSTAQPINGSLNISDLMNVTFADENNLSAMPIDGSSQIFTLTFPDGTHKNYTISYAGTSAVHNASVRAYPNFYHGNVSSVELYSKTAYIPATRYLVGANLSFAAAEAVTVYLLPTALSTATTINVVENGVAYPGAYVTVQRFLPSTNTYVTVQQVITNSQGQANFFGDVTAYYKFIVYSPANQVVYISTNFEQFTNPSGTGWSITLNVGSPNYKSFPKEIMVGTCYGVNSTSTIVFSFADISGITQHVRLTAYRYSNTTNPLLLLNMTINASSASYVFPLPAGENFTLYKYACVIETDAPPYVPFAVGLIDFTVAQAIADMAFVFICIVMALATCGLHPVMGIITLTIGLVCLSVAGVLTPTMLPAAALGYLIILAVTVVIFLLPKETS